MATTEKSQCGVALLYSDGSHMLQSMQVFLLYLTTSFQTIENRKIIQLFQMFSHFFSVFSQSRRIKFTSFDVSKTHIVFGANTGSLILFNAQTFAFIRIFVTGNSDAITSVKICMGEGKEWVAASAGNVVLVANFTNEKESPIRLTPHQVCFSFFFLSSCLLVFLSSSFLNQSQKAAVKQLVWDFPFLYTADICGNIFQSNIAKARSLFFTSRLVLGRWFVGECVDHRVVRHVGYVVM
jgi:archaellum component FlaG (FlaF/FlaG flagellin family)